MEERGKLLEGEHDVVSTYPGVEPPSNRIDNFASNGESKDELTQLKRTRPGPIIPS